MLERIYALMPSLTILVTLIVIGRIYALLMKKRVEERFKDLEWVSGHRLQITALFAPLMFIQAPLVEETAARFPLLVLFSDLSGWAWYGILASAALFSLWYWYNNEDYHAGTYLVSDKRKGRNTSNDSYQEVERIKKNHKKAIRSGRIYQTIMVFFLGVLAGYFSLKFQSIWWAVGIHIAWNIFFLTILPFVLVGLYLGIYALFFFGRKVVENSYWFLREKFSR